MNKLPDTFTLFILDGDPEGNPCRYIYEPEEPARWNGLTGAGSPGYPAYATVTETLIDGEWQAVEWLSDKQQTDLDDQLMRAIDWSLEAINDKETAE